MANISIVGLQYTRLDNRSSIIGQKDYAIVQVAGASPTGTNERLHGHLLVGAATPNNDFVFYVVKAVPLWNSPVLLLSAEIFGSYPVLPAFNDDAWYVGFLPRVPNLNLEVFEVA